MTPARIELVQTSFHSEDLGRRHSRYGVTPEHYEPVGEALLRTLEKGLGPAFTPHVKEAWTSAYTTLASVMTSAAAKAALPPPPARKGILARLFG